MIKLGFSESQHVYILWNDNPKPWEQRGIPITREKARELDKAIKKGELPERLMVIEYGYDNEGYPDDWLGMLIADTKHNQKELDSFFGSLMIDFMEDFDDSSMKSA